MNLYLVRHGIAVDLGMPECPTEAERFLTEEGVRKTRLAAQGLRALNIVPDALFSSPFTRAHQTAKIMAEVLGYKGRITVTDSLLPEAPPDDFLTEIRRLKKNDIMCFGHAPSIDDLLSFALGVGHFLTKLKKAGVAGLHIEPPFERPGTLLFLLTPQVLAKLAR